jgi:muramoyltetrapeptide carboxypeptidase
MIIPPFLQKGDTIGVAAPARKVSQQELQEPISILKSWGLEVKLANNLFNTNHQFSGTDRQRADDIIQLLKDPEVKAIISGRGGYGCVRILDLIPKELFLEHPKWLVGFSDLTAFHSHLHHLGIASIHAPMLSTFSRDTLSNESLRKALFGESLHYTFKAHRFNRPGNVKAKVTGGNLSLLYALSGSVSASETAGRILFLEDLDEYLYHIDRMMWQLKRSGKLENLAALLVGGFSDMKDNDTPFGKEALEIIKDAVEEYHYPVAFNFPGGHEIRNHSLYFGMDAHLLVHSNEESSLTYPFLMA